MSLILLSAIPLLLLIIFGPRLSQPGRFWLGVLSVPFFFILTFYAVILGIAITIAIVLIFQIQKWRYRKHRPSKHQPIEIVYDKRSDRWG